MSSVPLINIGGDANDPNYRYKMPKLVTRVEGRGNGIKTRLVNMADVAKALRRPAGYPTKFFACELGALCKINDSTSDYVVNGKHDPDELQKLLFVFIDKYVLCPTCKLPETDLMIQKKTFIYGKCAACGEVNKYDSVHKVSTYILRNPPKPDKMLGGKGGKRKEKEKKVEKVEKKKEKKKVEKNEEWSVDVSEGAVEARRLDALSTRLRDVTVSEGEEERASKLAAYASKSAKHSVKDIISKIDEVLAQGPMNREVLIRNVFTARFDENILRQVIPSAPIFRHVIQSESDEKLFMGQLERLLKANLGCARLFDNFPSILMGLTDEEVLSDDVLLRWFDHGSSDHVDEEAYQNIRSAARPFIAALRDDSDDEEEEESEGEAPKEAIIDTTVKNEEVIDDFASFQAEIDDL